MKKTRWVLLAAVGVVAVFAGATFAWIKIAEQRGYARMRERIEELRRAGECGARKRMPRGTPIPGRAWDCYRAALTAAVPSVEDSNRFSLPPSDPRPDSEAKPETMPDLDFKRGYVARYAKALDLLARGARSADLGDPVVTSGQTRWMAPDLITLAEVRIDVLLQEGRVREAVEPLLDLQRFYMDCEESGVPLRKFRSERDSVFKLFADSLESASMTPAEWADLESQLEVLDRGAPCYLLEPRRRLLNLGSTLLPGDPFLDRMLVIRQWRYFYSPTLLRQAVFFRCDEAFRSLEPLHEGAFPEFSKLWEELRRECEATSNPVLALFQTVGEIPNQDSRKHHAQIRLLRMAAAYRARGEFLELADPQGTVLLHAIEGDKVRLRSKNVELELKR